ncbi:uncharacterized protein KZ484_010955 [Pholidichthys leucotaenia]
MARALMAANDFPQKHDCKEEEVLADRQLWNQERNLILDQEKPEPPQLKEEHEEPEPPQIQDEQGSWHVDSGSTKEEEEPKPKRRRLKTGSHSNSDDDSLTSKTLSENETDAPQLHDYQEEEVLTVQQLWNQERNSSLDQENQDAAQVKEEEGGELCSSQEEEHFGLKQETDTFMVTLTDEDNDKSKTEPNSEQLLSHNSADAESQDQEAGGTGAT